MDATGPDATPDQMNDAFTLALGWLSLLAHRAELPTDAQQQARDALAAVEEILAQIQRVPPEAYPAAHRSGYARPGSRCLRHRSGHGAAR
jgi:hypothetical protein